MARKPTKARKRPIDPSDYGPEERGAHDRIIREETMTAGIRRGRVVTQLMLDRYRQRNEITGRQYEAGIKLWQDWYAAGRDMRVSGTYQPPTSKSEATMSDGQALAHVAFTKAIRALGLRYSPVVVHVVCVNGSLADWSHGRMHVKRAMERLSLGLDMLGDFYRMPINQKEKS